MFSKTDLPGRIKNADPWTKIAVVFFCTALVLILAAKNSNSSGASSAREEAESLSTYIPAGQRMVPVEILNSDALDSILGRFGFVDLYMPGQKRVFARGVRIVKSVDGSGAWAALVSESVADELMAAGARFHVAVQPLKNDTATRMAPAATRRKIVYEGN